jgi:UDP-glucose 4-epimerase
VPPLTVAVTGPTGDIGRALLRRLDTDPTVGRVLGMARREFDPASMGLRKTEYRQGDVLDRDAVIDLASDVDVLVHLAFIIVGGREETRSVNLEGSGNVFEAARGVRRLVYTSSVAAYGFHADNPQPLTEDVPVRGTDAHYYSAQKAELEQTLREALEGADTEAYVFRPCIVAGGDALALIEAFPPLIRKSPLPPVLPDPGTPFQLVHTEDVAEALAAAVRGEGEAGIYNLAGAGTISVGELARALGWRSVPVLKAGVSLGAGVVDFLPLMPPQASWLHALRVPVVMDTARAREQLGWEPTYDTKAVLADMARNAREAGLI